MNSRELSIRLLVSSSEGNAFFENVTMLKCLGKAINNQNYFQEKKITGTVNSENIC
jgi:hypothetical protein